ncbi:MAG: carboxypeptidase regulatory-like domain-containing protein, partial [Abditibacteriota bacterium]|nr:carboxypeptidase regulatory-like domain-containing protein [Abditibacteriota bacterium]
MGAFESNYNCVISGTVSSSDGGAVSGAKVAVGSVSSTTGSDGKYTLTLPRAASYTLSVTASGYDSQTATVDASGSTATKNF